MNSHGADNFNSEQRTAELYKRRLLAIRPLSNGELCVLASTVRHLGSASAQRRLWEQAQRIAIGAIHKACDEGRLPARCAYDNDILSQVALVLGECLDQWQLDKGAFSTFVTPRALGAALRACSIEAKQGITQSSGKVETISLSDTCAYEEDYSDGAAPGHDNMIPISLEDSLVYPTPPPQGLENPAELPDSYAITKATHWLPGVEGIALRRFYGLHPYSRPHTYREIAAMLALDHPQEAHRLVAKAQQSLQEIVTNS